MGSRQRSMLAWLASFGGPLAGVSGDHDAAWEPLEDGRLLLGLLLCLDKDADFGQEHESFITATGQAWLELLPRLRGLSSRTSRHIRAQGACTHEYIVTVLECFLGTAISQDSVGQARAIQQILSLEAADQVELKAVIEEQMTGAQENKGGDEEEGSSEDAEEDMERFDTAAEDRAVTDAAGDDEGEAVTAMGLEESSQARATSTPQQPGDEQQEMTSGAAEEEEEEGGAAAEEESPAWQQHYDVARVRRLETELARLRESEAAAHDRERQAQLEAEDLRQSLLSRSLTGEVQVMEMEEAYKQELNALKKKLAAAEKQASEAEQHRARMEQLQDEIDVLRPFPQRLEVAEEALARCRDKIQGLQDVKEQLQQEQAAHADLLERSLRQERELQQLPALKRQVDTYKQSLTDLEVSTRELQAELAEKDKEAAALRAETAGLQEVLSVSQARQEQLEKEVLAGKASGGAALSGIGDGVSECNPEVLEHIRTLEERCRDLETQVSDTAVERLERLSIELDDAKRLAASFEDKYRKTRSELADMTARMEEQTLRAETAEEEAKLLTETLELLEADASQRAKEAGEQAAMAGQEREALWATVRELRATVEMSQAEIDQRVYHHGRVSRCEFERSKAAAWLSSCAMRALTAELQHELGETARRLDETQQVVQSEKATREAAEMCVMLMRKDVENTQQAAEQAVASARNEAEMRLRDLQEQAMAAIQERESQYQQALSRMKQQMAEYQAAHDAVTNQQYTAEREAHQLAMQAKEREVAGLLVQVDELRMVQQRLEKEKRFLREEAQSMLAQERGAGGGGSQSVSSADLESLRAEFEALLREHKALKRQVRAAEEGIGFSLADFEPQEEKEGRGSSRRGPLEREFQVSVTPRLEDSEARHRGLKGLRSLKTPPERVPLPHQDDRSVKIDQLVDERRSMFLELTAAHAKSQKLEAAVATLETQLTERDAQLTSLNLKAARLQRQLDMLSESKGGGLMRGDKENMLPMSNTMQADVRQQSHRYV